MINSFWARKHLAKFRTSNHDLAIEKGRHAKLERHMRMCNMCNLGCVEDEYHFILICPKYENLREKYLPWRFRNFPSSAKFVDLMSSNNDQTVISLSTFIYQAFKVRKHADRCICWQTKFFEFSYSELKWLSIFYYYLYQCQQFMYCSLAGRGGPRSVVCGSLRDALWVLAGCSVGCGRGVRHWGTINGGARYQALLGWGLWMACCVSACHGASWASADRALQSSFSARLLFGSHEYYVYSLETNTIFLTQLQNLEYL